MRSRRALASATFVLMPLLLTGCSGTEVSDFFSSHGFPVSQQVADKLASLISFFEARAEHAPPPACPPPTTAATTTTTSTTTPGTGSANSVAAPTNEDAPRCGIPPRRRR